MTRIYRYVVRYDAGAAPNPYGGCCSLAICKPSIRKTAQRGDWIVGLRSGQPDHVIYVMRIDKCITFEAYWNDPAYEGKKPHACASSDNIYKPEANNSLVQVPNKVHNQSDITRDLSGHRVLVGTMYWYFGRNSPKLPIDLHHLIHKSQGHSVDINRRADDLQRLESWLSQWPTGIHGSPIDSDRLRDLMQPNSTELVDAISVSSDFNTQKPRAQLRASCG